MKLEARPDAQHIRYTPFYCEENIWYLAQQARFRGLTSWVAMISGEGRYRRLWHQSQAGDPNSPVYWDYHVLLLVYGNGWWVWDLDSTLGLPVLADSYFPQTFLRSGIIAEKSDVILRLIESDCYVQNFSSDRSHMRSPTGAWLAPPPNWPPVMKDAKSNLLDWLDISREGPGQVVSLGECLKNGEWHINFS